MAIVWMRSALRRSGGGRDGVFDGRNRECYCCFSRFAADLLKITNSGSANDDPVLGICKQFARNGANSNGIQGTPYKYKGFPVFD